MQTGTYANCGFANCYTRTLLIDQAWTDKWCWWSHSTTIPLIANPKYLTFTYTDAGCDRADKIGFTVVICFTNATRDNLIDTLAIVAHHVGWTIGIFNTILATLPCSIDPFQCMSADTG